VTSAQCERERRRLEALLSRDFWGRR